MNEVTKDGTASVRRIYGDWTNPRMRPWRDGLLQHSILPIQQFTYAGGNNSSDGAMMVDATDLLHSDRFSRSCLITSDSDFTRLAARIREQGVDVHGFGNKTKVHRALVAACNNFSYLEELPVPSGEASKETALTASPRTPVAPTSPSTSWRPVLGNGSPAYTTQLLSVEQSEAPLTPSPALFHEKPLDRAAIEDIRRTFIKRQNLAEKDEFVNSGLVGNSLSPDLHHRRYDYSNLATYLLASGIVETKYESGSGRKVRLDSSCQLSAL